MLLPILLPFQNVKDSFERTIKVVDELVSAPVVFPIQSEFLKSHEIIVEFQILDNEDERIKLIEKKTLRNHIYIIAQANLEVSNTPIDGKEELSTSSELFTGLTVDHFIKRMYDFIICINIAKVGSIEVNYGLTFIDKEKYKITNMMISLLEEVYYFTKKTKWPLLEELEIRSVWEWLGEKKGFLDGVGGTPIERALTALSYLFGSSDESNNEGMDLFYSMIGLEALYCSSNNGIKEQLIEKTQVFLGTQNDYKKLFKRMYDYRSKFIHGSLNFPGKYNIFDAAEEFEHYMSEYIDVILMAQSVLISTIQQLSKRNMNYLDFKYSLVNKKS
ncbi:hypothetical protein EPK97_09995 [Chengkuizengella sediminis]|nr:hypothetical protein [Chengkuizengella sediminis]